MYYVTDGLYCLSNQVIWQGSPFISIMQELAVDSDDFVASSTCSSNVVLLEAGKAASELHYFYKVLIQVHFFFSQLRESVLYEQYIVHCSEINHPV